jgi:hypothetical protein
MTYLGGPVEGLRRCMYCPSPLRSSSSKSELPVFSVKGHLFGMDQHGLREATAARSSLEVSLVKSESLARGVVMTMTLASLLDDESRLLRCVHGWRLVARVALCVLATSCSMTVGEEVFVPVFGRFPNN